MLDYDGLGMRIPMLIVSPYAKKGHLSHVHYEHGSILKFVEDNFGLQALSASDSRATSPEADASISTNLRGSSRPSRRYTASSTSCTRSRIGAFRTPSNAAP